MEPHELKLAWQSLGLRLQRQEQIQWQLLRERKLEKVRRSLRPLFWGQALQAALGVAVLLLGIACWSRNAEVPGLFAAGIVLHAFGVLTAVMAVMTLALAGCVDYSAPVVRIQKQFALLGRVHLVNAIACGLPWWVMWVLVVVGVAGLTPAAPGATTPTWIGASLAVGVVGWLATVAGMVWQSRRRGAVGRRTWLEDGGSIHRGSRLLEEIERFEKE